MKKRVIPAISVTLKPSYCILGCYVCISMLSIIAILLTNLTWQLQAIVILTVIIATIFVLLQDVWLVLPWSWHKVEVSSQGVVSVTTKRQQARDIQLLASSVNHRWLTILHIRRSSKSRGMSSTVLLTPWQVQDANQYRKLRVWLKWGNPLAADHAPDVLPLD